MRKRIYKEVKSSPRKREEIIEEVPLKNSSKKVEYLKGNLDAIVGKINLVLEENTTIFKK